MNNELRANLDKFNKLCEDDFRKILASFLNILQKKPQSGGAGSKGPMYTGLNIKFLNELINKKTGKFKGNLENNSKRKQPLNNNNQSQKSTVNNSKPKLSPLSYLNIPNFYLTELPNVKLPKVNQSLSSQLQLSNVREMRKTSIHECQIYDYLKEKSEFFINKSTCFVRCSDDSIFLRDCGITFKELILENKDNANLFQYILKKLFEKIHFLHLLGVAHNNLDCIHVLVGKRESINWTRMKDNQLKNLPANSYLNMPFLRKNIDIRLINFSKATILQPELEIDVDYLKGIFEHYTNSLQTLFR
jgi:hypothetical protein